MLKARISNHNKSFYFKNSSNIQVKDKELEVAKYEFWIKHIQNILPREL